MNTFKSSPGVLLDCLRPFFEGPNFRDLKVQCRNGESLLTTRLLFSAFLHPSVLTELCQLDQILGDDAQACIILTDSNVNDVEELIAASIKNDDSKYINIDAEFTDKFYWCDVVKLSTKNVELVSSNRRQGVVKSGEKVTQHKSPRKRKKAAIEVTEVPVELVKQEQDDDDFLHDQYGDLHEETERDWLEDQGLNPGLQLSKIQPPFVKLAYSDQLVSKSDRKVKNNAREKLFTCPMCSSCFGAQSDLNSHIKGVHSDKQPYKCDACSSIFPKKWILNKHVQLVHNLERLFQCDRCPKTFGQNGHLTSHIAQVHEKKRPFKCDVCLKCFSSKRFVREHIRTVHEGEKPFQCEFCSNCFSRKNNLLSHTRVVHKKEKPYLCEICSRSFARRAHLVDHTQFVHGNEKPFKCEECNKAFSRKDNWKEHINAIHKKEKHHQCKICEKKFGIRSNLYRHNKLHHNKNPDTLNP